MTEINTNEFKHGQVYLCKIGTSYRPYIIGLHKLHKIMTENVPVYPLTTKKSTSSGYYFLQDDYNGKIDENTVVCVLEDMPTENFVKYITTLTENDMKNITNEWKKQLGIS